MNKISLVSNVTNKRVCLNRSDTFFLQEAITESAFSPDVVTELNKDIMSLLKENIEELIDKRLLSRENDATKGVKYYYKEKSFDLNLRNHSDFVIGAMLSVQEIIDITLNLSGHIYIYSPDALLEHNKSDVVLAFIRGKYSVKVNELADQIVSFYNRIPNPINLDSKGISNSVNYLLSLGLIDHDQILNEYSVTSKGYLMW